MIVSMADTLQQLSDREAIVGLCVQYAAALDQRDWAMLRQCFLPDVVAEYAGIGTLRGYDAVEQVCRQALEPLGVSQHLLGNFAVELDGDDARCRCYFQAQHVREGTPGGDKYLVAGAYTDRVVRQPEGWRIAHRALDVMWTDGNSAVLQVP